MTLFPEKLTNAPQMQPAQRLKIEKEHKKIGTLHFRMLDMGVRVW
jgi:hypothetical protein